MTEPDPKERVRYACVCSSNVNRSMAAHEVLKKHNYRVSSYGTNIHVKMPGPRPDKPNVYEFGTTYQEIYDDLLRQDNPFYREIGLIDMIDRDRHIKTKPEKFAHTFDRGEVFDIIFTYQEHVMEAVIMEFHRNGNASFELCTVVNIETPDDHAHALESAKTTLQLAKTIEQLTSIPEEIEAALSEFVRQRPDAGITFHIVSY